MAEEPIKLFATRAEQFPQPSDSDIAHAAVRAVVSAVPLLGGPINQVLSLVLGPPVARRRDEWLKELADALEQLETKFDGFKMESLENNEAFVSAALQATQIALRTHQHEKREYLRNALLKVAIGKGPDETRQQIFMNAIDAFSPAHVEVLDLLWRNFRGKNLWEVKSTPLNNRNYGAAIQIVVPELIGQVTVIEAVLSDLKNRGFSNLGGPQLSFPQGGQITNLGIEFLNFILDPEDL